MYYAGRAVGGRVLIYASSLVSGNNVNAYTPTGTKISSDYSDAVFTVIAKRCEIYNNFVEVNKEVNLETQLADFESYIEI